MSTGRKLRVAQVITRFNGGGGRVALNGALALPDGTYERAIVTGGVGMDSEPSAGRSAAGRTAMGRDAVLHGDEAVANAAAGDLTPAAYRAGMEIVQVGPLVPQISPRDDLAALSTLTRVLAEGRYDVVHTHSSKAGVIGRLAAARAGVPRIVHTWHGFPFNEFQSWARRTAYIRLERIAAKHTDAFLGIGSETVTTALRLGLTTPERVRLSWPAVDVDAYAPAPGARAQARRRLDLPLGVKVVGSVGRLTFQKGPEIFARAIARLPDDVFGLWVGGGPMAERLAKLTAKLGVEDRMRWLGHSDDVAAVLPAFDLMAMASRWEGLPCVLVEAISAGIPLVATAVPSNQDLVLAGETGLLVPPEDPERLAGAIAALLDDPAAADRMAERARGRIGEWFSPAHLGTVLDETYRGTSRRPYRRS